MMVDQLGCRIEWLIGGEREFALICETLGGL
jgi:hypothetical protein